MTTIRLILFACLLSVTSCVHSNLYYGKLPSNVSCIAVLPFEIRYDTTSNEETLSEFISLELEKTGTLGVAGPLQLSKLFKASKDPFPPVIDLYWAREIGKKLGVDAVILGSIGQIPLIRDDDVAKLVINIDAYLLSVSDGVIRWSYGVKEEIRAEDYATRLSQHAEWMVGSLLISSEASFYGKGAQCWQAPAPKEEPTPVAKAEVKPKKPAPVINKKTLSLAQTRLLEDVSKPGGYMLPGSIFEGRTDHFTKQGTSRLKDLAEALKDERAPKSIMVSGNMDASKDPGDDLEISKLRAQALKDFLVKNGIATERIEAVGHGSTQPLVPNLNQKSRVLNRRIEILSLDALKK